MVNIVKFAKNVGKFFGTWRKLKKFDEQKARFQGYFIGSLFFLCLGAFLPFPSSKLPLPEDWKKKLGILAPEWSSPISNIIVGVSASVAAACLIEIFSGIREVWRQEEEQKDFRELLGIDNIPINQIPQKVAIVIPRFPMHIVAESIQSSRESAVISYFPFLVQSGLYRLASLLFENYRNANDPLTVRIREELERSLDPLERSLDPIAIQSLKSDRSFLASVDMRAAMDILLKFQSLKLPLPEIKWDDETGIKDFDTSDTFSALIVIGLFSNRISMQYCNEKNQNYNNDRLFDLKQNSPEDIPTLRVFQRNSLQGIDSKNFREFQGQENCLLAKIKFNNSKVLFFVGGISANGTEKLGKIFSPKDPKQNWNTIYSKRDSRQPEIQVKDRPFAMCINFLANGSLEKVYCIVKEKEA